MKLNACMRQLGHWGCLASVLALAACSSLNPFATEPKHKPAELGKFTPTAEISRLWRSSVGESKDTVFTPAVVGAHVYAAGADGVLARFDEGRETWRQRSDKRFSAGVGADDQRVAVATLKGEVLVYAADTGKPLWQAQVSSEVLAIPLVTDKYVIVRSGDARIFGFDAATGKRLWVYQRSSPTLALRSQAGIVASPRAILAGFSGGKLVAINPVNGASLWEATVALPRGTTELERVTDVASLPVVYENTVCAVAYQGRLACFELSNGTQLWTRDVSSSQGLAADQKAVYVSDEQGVLQAYGRSNGASLWQQDKLTYRGLGRPLVVGNHVAVGDALGVLHLLERDSGRFAARIALDGALMAAPQAYRDGLVVQSINGSVQALGVH